MGDQDPGSGEGTDFLLAEEAAANGGHPAWQEVLDAIPQEYHDALRPTLEKWDKGVANRFQSLHSKYEPLKQYEALAEYDPEELQVAMQLRTALENDPRAVWDLMAQTYNFASEQGATTEEQGMTVNDDGSVDPRYEQMLAEQQRQIAELQARQQADEADAELDAYMSSLHTKYDEQGGFDEDFVVALLANGIDGDEAVTRYQGIVTAAAGSVGPPKPTPPVVMGSGGGVPSNNINPVSLSNSETKDLVAQMLAQAQGE